MTKTISIYAAQVVLGVIAIAAGYAKLSGTGLMVHQFHQLGLGQGFLMVAGTSEMVAGLCLLMPRGGILGALFADMRHGRRPRHDHRSCGKRGAGPHPALTSTSYQATHGAGSSQIQIFRARAEWDI